VQSAHRKPSVLQDHFSSVLKALGGLKLGTLTQERTLEAGSYENDILRGFMHLINDHRLQLRLAPKALSVGRLPQLLQTAASAPAVTQAGMPAYALLSPVADALEHMQLLARGNESHMKQMTPLKGHILGLAAGELWTQALQKTQQSKGLCTPAADDEGSVWLSLIALPSPRAALKMSFRHFGHCGHTIAFFPPYISVARD
jgi:hypothetical protein